MQVKKTSSTLRNLYRKKKYENEEQRVMLWVSLSCFFVLNSVYPHFPQLVDPYDRRGTHHHHISGSFSQTNDLTAFNFKHFSFYHIYSFFASAVSQQVVSLPLLSVVFLCAAGFSSAFFRLLPSLLSCSFQFISLQNRVLLPSLRFSTVCIIFAYPTFSVHQNVDA